MSVPGSVFSDLVGTTENRLADSVASQSHQGRGMEGVDSLPPLLIEELEKEGEEFIKTMGLNSQFFYNTLSFGLVIHGYRLVGTFANTLYPHLQPVYDFSRIEDGDTLIAHGKGKFVVILPYEEVPF